MKKLVFVMLVVAFLISASSCGLLGRDGICDHAGCKKEADCDFGDDMEFCLRHYMEWSDKAHKNNEK